jgi:hypothetical protein
MSKECDCRSDKECSCGEKSNSCGCDGGCGGHGSHMRRFQTKAERIPELEAYLSDLKTETQAVEEHLADLRR